MRTLTAVSLALLLAGSLSAQRRSSFSFTPSGFGNVVFPGTGRVPRNPNVSGFGNVVFPGTGGPPPPFSITNPGFAKGLANTVSGRVPFGAGQQFGRNRGNFNRGNNFVYVPYAFPVYSGGYPYANGPDSYVQPDPSSVGAYGAPPQQPVPQQPVVVNQNFGGQPTAPQPGAAPPPEQGATPNVQMYQAPQRSPEEMQAAADQASQPYYLIAFNDHSIYSAVAYWIQGDTLHYFTSGNVHNQVSMSLVDKELTERLNTERHVTMLLK